MYACLFPVWMKAKLYFTVLIPFKFTWAEGSCCMWPHLSGDGSKNPTKITRSHLHRSYLRFLPGWQAPALQLHLYLSNWQRASGVVGPAGGELCVNCNNGWSRKKIHQNRRCAKKVPRGAGGTHQNRGNAKTKMSPLINLVWCFFLWGEGNGWLEYRRRIQTDATVLNFRTARLGEENSPPLIALSIAPPFVSLSTAYLYLYIVWLMCSRPGASEEM